MPQYFFKYPKILNNNILLTDLVTRIKIMDNFLDNDNLYYKYLLKDSDTPESIAHKYYKNPELHWIILLANNIFDVNFDLPMPQEIFDKYILEKYADSYAVSSVEIENNGSGYVSDYYQNVPLKIYNENQLEKIGSGAIATINVSGGSVSNISIQKGGSNYSANTIFTVDNSYLGGSGNGFTCSILNFMNGLEYSLTTVDPTFGYQKQIVITNEITGEVFSKTSYNIDEKYYYELYEDSDPMKKVVSLEDGTVIRYETLRKPVRYIYDYEAELNENKREIKILKEEFFPYVVDQFVQLISR